MSNFKQGNTLNDLILINFSIKYMKEKIDKYDFYLHYIYIIFIIIRNINNIKIINYLFDFIYICKKLKLTFLFMLH